MSRSRRPRHALSLALALSSFPALACGPDFPISVLDQRESLLADFPEGSFDSLVSQLVDVSGLGLAPVDETWRPQAQGLRQVEAEGLTTLQQQQVLRLRELSSAKQVRMQAQNLPAAVEHYTAGAVAWSGGDLHTAISEFDAVLSLPMAERGTRGPMAAYMRARGLDRLNEPEAARAAFQQVRDAVRAGEPDPLGLAVSSLGEEARIELESGNPRRAVELYAQQAALGSASGRASLLFVARRLVPDANARAELLQSDAGRGVLLAYLLARSHELPPELPAADQAFEAYDPWESASGPAHSESVLRLFDELELQLPEQAAARDRLAVVAYRAGRFEAAARALGTVDSALGHWLRAKLALRAGDPQGAAQAYARALSLGAPDPRQPPGATPIQASDVAQASLDTRCRIGAEAGTLALSRGDYLQAMALFFGASDRYWRDAAHLAERVLTSDELKDFVDREVPEPQAAVAESWVYGTQVPRAALRALLARRLLREGRQQSALDYFDDPQIHADATAYVEALAASARGDAVERARAGFTAAALARTRGMELIGYQFDPDYAEYEGLFDLNPNRRWDRHHRVVIIERADITVPEALSTVDERGRVAASVAQPLHRFHYRGVAANQAEAAANALPPRSQAWAALMCEATRYVLDSDPARAQQLYRRYLREGAYVPWGGQFGQTCPAPDFDKLERELHAAWVAKMQRRALWSLPPLLLLSVALWVWRRRRSRHGGGAAAAA